MLDNETVMEELARQVRAATCSRQTPNVTDLSQNYSVQAVFHS
jgi:hypothetical protein